MDQLHFKEMSENLERLVRKKALLGRRIYLFGHCSATEELVDLLMERGVAPTAILDNNRSKQGNICKGIPIIAPDAVMSKGQEHTVVCIVARAYASMLAQLKRMGYLGAVYRLVDYNSYAEYSLSKETLVRMGQRVKRGRALLHQLSEEYPGYFRILCPFFALGDIYFMMSYLPYFLKNRGIGTCVVGVVGDACAQVVRLFGDYHVKSFQQKEIDEMVQAALYTMDTGTFIPHQDRPYVVNLHKALYIRKIPLETVYCCGVFGLPVGTQPVRPEFFHDPPYLEQIKEGRAVIFSPYAKSVTAICEDVWRQIVSYYQKRGYQCFTSVAQGEQALSGTQPVCAKISEMKAVVERAGLFIGIRSGMCDILREAKAEKIALYPDYHYCDTKWKAVDIYALDGWENIVVKDGFQWKRD